MSRSYPKSSRVRKSTGSNGRRKRGRPRRIEEQARASAREVQLPLNVEALVEMTREALSSFAVEMGLKVAQCLLEDEVAQRCGQRHERVPERSQTRFGHPGGFITIAGQKVSVERPRVRYTDGRGEAELERYTLLQSPEAMPQSALEHLVNGVSTRRYEKVVHAARAGFGIKKSSVSRGFALLPIFVVGLWHFRLWGFICLVLGFLIVLALHPHAVYLHAACIVVTLVRYYFPRHERNALQQNVN